MRKRGHLLDPSKEQLRSAFAEQLEEASARYLKDGMRTLVLVDGLDHVERDHLANESLLCELPRPDAIPAGVLFVVGTRTLTPLPPEARQQVESEERQLNLDTYRLSSQSVISICERAPTTATLGSKVHGRIVQLAEGHPLALSYLLNRLVDADEDNEALDLLSSHPRYDGDIANQYRAIWESLESQTSAQELLARVTRLRVPFTLDELREWFGPEVSRLFRDKLSYLFRTTGTLRSVFHDSFRQFVIHWSNPSDLPSTDPAWDAAYHSEIADLCRNATSSRLRWEELYHRYRAGQDFLQLASQQIFRTQCVELRSTSLIREDLRLVMEAASERHDLVALIDAALAKSEAESRWSALQTFDVSGAFMDAALPVEAVAFAGVDFQRTIPLGQAYALAARLALAGNSAGRRVFDVAESSLFRDADFSTYSGHEHDAYISWAECASLYRPLPWVLSTIRRLFPGDPPNERDPNRDEARHRFLLATEGVVDSLARSGRVVDLDAVDELLVGLCVEGDEVDALLTDCFLRVLQRRAEAAADEDASALFVANGLELAASSLLYRGTLLVWAELAVEFGFLDAAQALLGRTELDRQLTTRDLSFGRDKVLDERFRYWRLRHRLHRLTEPQPGDEVLESVPPDATTPAGNDIKPDAFSHRNLAAIELARHIDRAVRMLAAARASLDEGEGYESGVLTREIVPMLDIGRFSDPRQATMDGLRAHRPEVLELIVSVVLAYGQSPSTALAERIGARVAEDPSEWSMELRLQLGQQFADAGMTLEWYRTALAAAEREIVGGDLDVDGRLSRAVALTEHYARLGAVDGARRVALSLLHLAFGVGYRKDYQFDDWLNWLHLAIDDGLPNPVEETVAFGHLLSATAPMTEGAPGRTAARLPSALAAQFPGASVLLFEYLVRAGTVDHLDSLAALITSLTPHLQPSPAVVDAARHFVTDLLARSSVVPYPKAVHALVARYTEAFDEDTAAASLKTMRDDISCYALASRLAEWLEPLGVTTATEPEEERDSTSNYGGLDLRDGTHLSEREADDRITDAASLIALRGQTETGSYHWDEAIGRVSPDSTQLVSLEALFSVEGSHRDAAAHLAIGQHFLRHGDRPSALQHASIALLWADESSWGPYWGTTRLDAHALAITAGGELERQQAWMDVAHCASSSPWRAEIMLHELGAIMRLLDQNVSPLDVWPLVRAHLDGMAESLELSNEDPIRMQPVRWWFKDSSPTVERLSATSSATEALAVLIVDHASHFLWNVTNAAIAVAANALADGFSEIGQAIETVLNATPPDDVVEALGRIVKLSGSTGLSNVQSILAAHPNDYVRQLSDLSSPSARQLPPRYRLQLPPGGERVLGAADITLGPFEADVRLCAFTADLDEDLLVEHALMEMRNRRHELPSDEAVKSALNAAEMNFRLPMMSMFLARSVAGRLVGDFRAAGYLSALPSRTERLFRSFDPALYGVRPVGRPVLAPPAPPTGHEVTGSSWIAGTGDRLDSYVSAMGATDEYVLAAKTHASVLNFAYATERLTAFSFLGQPECGDRAEDPDSEDCLTRADLVADVTEFLPDEGDSLIIENRAASFHQIEVFWIAFAPGVARHLGWQPVPEVPGEWATSEGSPAIRAIEWVDGWPGRGERAHEDSESAGTLIVATSDGMRDLVRLGPVTRLSRLSRRGREDNGGPKRWVSASTERVDLLLLQEGS